MSDLSAENDAAPSYHDLHITTASLPRTPIFNLPYGYEVSCNRVGGWCVWLNGEQVAGEYGEGLRLDVAGHVICDSLSRPIPPEGWLPFGSLIDHDGPAECSDDVGEDGLPLWERPIPPGATERES